MNELVRAILNLPEQASSFAVGLDWLHITIIGLTVLGSIGVTLTTMLFVVRHHETSGAPRSTPRGIRRSREVVVICGLLALFVTFWVIGYRQYLVMATPPSDTFDVYVIGKQWMWSFAYADGASSAGDLYVPVGKPVRMLLTSRDVIHSFFVPAMRIKQDAVPGRMTTAWFEAVRPGSYEVLCAEYCGLSHSRMRGRVIALPPQDYERWRSLRWDVPAATPGAPLAGTRSDRPPERESMVAMGERIAGERGCLRCHTLDGTPHLGPTWAGLYMAAVPLEGASAVRADPAYLTRAMMDPTAELHAGFPAIMPSYMGLLDAPEVAALVELIRSLRDRARADGEAMPLPADNPASLPSDLRMPAPSSP